MNKKIPKYLIILILFAISLFLFCFSIIYSYANINDSQVSYLSKKNQIEALKTRENQLKNDDNYQRIDKSLEELNLLFTDAERPIESVLFLRKIGNNNNLIVDVDLEKKEKADDNWPHLSLELNFSGDFYNVVSFLKDLYFLDKIFMIEEINLKKINSQNNQMVSGDLILKLYYLPKN